MATTTASAAEAAGGAPPEEKEVIDLSQDSEEELECRVCRGEAEPGRRLFAPCKCSGSIRYTHSDCLEQWLEHSGKNFCELCGFQFQFEPLYDANAPQVLPLSELFTTLLKLSLVKWLPFVLRAVVVALLWLGVAPWCTNWLYRVWLLRASVMVNVNFQERFTLPLVVQDTFAGIILILCIIFSFLALMSFSDFLRFHLDEPMEEPNGPHARRPVARNGGVANDLRQVQERLHQVDQDEDDIEDEEDLSDDDVSEEEDEEEVEEEDAWIGRQHVDELRRLHEQQQREHERDLRLHNEMQEIRRRHGGVRQVGGLDHLGRPDLDRPDGNLPELARIHAAFERFNVPDQDRNHADVFGPRLPPPPLPQLPPLAPPVPAQPAPANNQNVNNRNDWDDDFDHMEINIAVDELLGLRGNLFVLFRNVSWFLAFNGAYLGLFAFIPYTLGSTILSALVRVFAVLPLPFDRNLITTYDPNDLTGDGKTSTLLFLFRALHRSIETAQANGDCLQLVDLCTCCLGYLSICFTIVLWRFLVSTVSSYVHRPLMGGLLWALRCLTAIVKVSTLLILKMVVLPVILGMGLDLATLQLFEVTARDRILLFTSDMVGAVLIHWVLGITFMLFVTVSVLQLREVVHPDILAKVIRPQEAHPDLLRTLLVEKCVKHARRMIISLVIYAALLVVLVHLPVRAAHFLVPQVFPLEVRFQYYFTQLQVPLELFVVHLVVLGILEHAKNDIGHFQHVAIAYIAKKLGLTEYLLPRIAVTPGAAENSSMPVGKARASELVLPPPPLHFHPQNMLPPEEQRIRGHRYLPWPEEGAHDQMPLEYQLLPRKTPPQVATRLLGLTLCAWVTCVVVIFAGVFGPLYVGRLCTRPFESITGIRHEPIAMVAGTQIMCYLASSFNAAIALMKTSDELQPALIQKGYVIRHASTANVVFCVASWNFACPLIIGCLIAACFPTAKSTLTETYWMGYLSLNLFAWFICCFRSKKPRRRRNGRRAAPVNDDEDEEDEENDFLHELNENANQADQPAVVVGGARGFLASLRACHQQILFHVRVHDINAAQIQLESIRDKCLDLQQLRNEVIGPILVCCLAMLLLPMVISSLIVLVLSSSLPVVEKTSFAFSFMTVASALLFVRFRAKMASWLANVQEKIKNERYLIGRQLQDMVR